MQLNHRFIRVAIFLVALISLAGCIPVGTTVAINSPTDGSTVPINKEIFITASATDAIGITRIELWDEGVIFSTAQSTLAEGQTTFTATFPWTPRQLGARLLVAKAYNRQSADQPSALAVLNLQVADPGSITPTATATTVPVTPGAITATPTRTNTPGPSLTPSVTPPPTITPTATPAPIPAAPGNLVANGVGSTIQFAWQENSIGELGFRIYEQGGVAPVADNIPPHVGTGGMTFTLPNLPCNKTGTYVVKAFNAAGESPASNPANAFTIPCAPSNVSVSPATSTSVNFSFNNNATNESGFTLYTTNSPNPLPPISVPTGSGAKNGSVGGLQCGATVGIFARAFNSAGESSNSNVAEATTHGCNVTVTFTQMRVIDDSNPKPPSCGGLVPCNAALWVEFLVNGQGKRHPATGTTRATTGDTLQLPGIVSSFVLVRSQNLNISVTGTDLHTFQPNHLLGVVTKTYLGSDNWGAGTHTDKSNCPAGCYDVTYTIEVKP